MVYLTSSLNVVSKMHTDETINTNSILPKHINDNYKGDISPATDHTDGHTTASRVKEGDFEHAKPKHVRISNDSNTSSVKNHVVNVSGDVRKQPCDPESSSVGSKHIDVIQTKTYNATVHTKSPDENIAKHHTGRNEQDKSKHGGLLRESYQVNEGTRTVERIPRVSIKTEQTQQSGSTNVSARKESNQSSKTIQTQPSLQKNLRNSLFRTTNRGEPTEVNKITNEPQGRESLQSYSITHMKSVKPKKPGVTLETVQSTTFSDTPFREKVTTGIKGYEITPVTTAYKVTEKTISKQHLAETTDNESLDEQSTYIRAVMKLPTIGPLLVNDLDDFLRKSKIDFEHFYSKKKHHSTLQITDFNLKKTLGVGGFGKVVLGELKKDKVLYALKIIEKVGVVKRNHVRYVSNEKKILQALNFPFVINLKYFFTDFYYLYFVMPYVPGGNFSRHLKIRRKLKESEAKFYVGQIVLALEYLHHLELIHRDVKTENIMIDALGYLKLVDFGQCVRCYGHDKTWTFTGTPEYMAPEIIVGKGYDSGVDWWALGIITFELCAGFRPFKHENSYKLQLLILCNQYSTPSGFSSSLKKLIENLLVLEPKNRIANWTKKASQIKKHVWFKGMDWLALLNRTVEAPYLPNLNRLSQ